MPSVSKAFTAAMCSATTPVSSVVRIVLPLLGGVGRSAEHYQAGGSPKGSVNPQLRASTSPRGSSGLMEARRTRASATIKPSRRRVRQWFGRWLGVGGGNTFRTGLLVEAQHGWRGGQGGDPSDGDQAGNGFENQ